MHIAGLLDQRAPSTHDLDPVPFTYWRTGTGSGFKSLANGCGDNIVSSWQRSLSSEVRDMSYISVRAEFTVLSMTSHVSE